MARHLLRPAGSIRHHSGWDYRWFWPLPPGNSYKTSTGLRARTPPRVSPCGEILVVLMSLGPRRSCTARRSEPDSRRWVAKQCRTVWQVAGFGIPAGRRRRHGGRHRSRECMVGRWGATSGPGGDPGLATGDGTAPHRGWQRQAGRTAGLTRLRGAIPSRSHGASSVDHHGEGERSEGYARPPRPVKRIYSQTVCQSARTAHRASPDYTRLFRMGGPAPAGGREPCPISVPGGRTAN